MKYYAFTKMEKLFVIQLQSSYKWFSNSTLLYKTYFVSFMARHLKTQDVEICHFDQCANRSAYDIQVSHLMKHVKVAAKEGWLAK